jgi:hypothetical protein
MKEVTVGGRGSGIPGADGALGRAWAGEGDDMGNDGYLLYITLDENETSSVEGSISSAAGDALFTKDVAMDDTQGKAQTPTVSNATSEQKEAITTGHAEAEKRLDIGSCADFFGGKNTGLETLHGFKFVIDSRMPANGHPQAALDDDNVTLHVNPHGSSFVTPANSSYTFYLFDPSKPQMYTMILSGAQASAFAQLHETGHRAHSYGTSDIDAFTPQTFLNNYLNNFKIWKACFSEIKLTKTSFDKAPMPQP